jgi:hypothetical protein
MFLNNKLNKKREDFAETSTSTPNTSSAPNTSSSTSPENNNCLSKLCNKDVLLNVILVISLFVLLYLLVFKSSNNNSGRYYKDDTLGGLTTKMSKGRLYYMLKKYM